MAQDFAPNAMTGSAVASVVGAEIVHVGQGCLADDYLADPAGKVALIRRGACSFAEKVERAETAGAIGTVVANNAPGNFNGTLGEYSAVGPSASVSQAEGDVLVAEIEGGTTIVDFSVVATDYQLIDGTSFSAPHVAGVAALIKSVNPALSPIEVRKIIGTTAEPIGHQVIFGAGMVRADRAVEAAQASQ
jgi:subtilisin family serine protease